MRALALEGAHFIEIYMCFRIGITHDRVTDVGLHLFQALDYLIDHIEEPTG